MSMDMESTGPKSFRKFVWGTPLVGMGVGMAMGMAVMGLVTLIVKDILLPLATIALGGADLSSLHWVIKEGSPGGPYESAEAARQAGAVTIHYGMVLVAIVTFTFVTLAMWAILRRSYKVQMEP